MSEIRIVPRSYIQAIMKKPIDDSFKKVAFQYAQDKEFLQLSPCKEDTQSKIYQNFYYELLIFIEIFRINIQRNYSL